MIRDKRREGRIRRKLCYEMHWYLVDHGGKVGRWPLPDSKWEESFKDVLPDVKFIFGYFDHPYVWNSGSKTADKSEGTYRFTDAFQCPADPPMRENEAKAKVECSMRVNKVGRAEIEAKEKADKKLKEAIKEKPSKFIAILGVLAIVLLAVALLGGYFGPWLGLFDLDTAADSLKEFGGSLSGWKLVLAYIPIVVVGFTFTLMRIVESIGALLLDMSTTAFLIGGAVVVVGTLILVLVVYYTFEMSVLFRDPTAPARQKAQEAARAAELFLAERKRIEEQFWATEGLEAKQKDDLAYERWKDMHEHPEEHKEFARRWQEEWFDAFMSRQRIKELLKGGKQGSSDGTSHEDGSSAGGDMPL